MGLSDGRGQSLAGTFRRKIKYVSLSDLRCHREVFSTTKCRNPVCDYPQLVAFRSCSFAVSPYIPGIALAGSACLQTFNHEIITTYHCTPKRSIEAWGFATFVHRKRLLRGTIAKRTYVTNKNLHISLCLQRRFRLIYYGLP